MKRSRIGELKLLLKTMLTDDQLQELAAWGLIVGGDDFLLDLENRLKGDELSTAAHDVWDCWRSERGLAPAPSASKLLQKWGDLCERWMETVESSSDMEGRYSGERNHWEPPWWDASSLMFDLDEIAGGMRPLVDDVFAEGGPFPFSFEEIELVRVSLPEWVRDNSDPPVVGAIAVEITLRWEWLSCRNATRFVEKVRDLEELFDDFPVDDKGAELFVDGLASEERKALFDALSEVDDWPFPDVYLKLAEEFDQSAWLRRSTGDIPRNWRLGEPVLKDCLRREDWEGVNETAAAMLSSCLRYDKVSLDDTLLWKQVRWQRLKDDEQFIGLLRDWRTAANHSGDQRMARVLECQLAVLQDQHDWDRMLDGLRGETLFRLREDWLTLMDTAHHQSKDPAGNWITVLWRGMLDQESPVEIVANMKRKIRYIPLGERDKLRSLAILTGDLLALTREFPRLRTLCESIGKCEEYAEERRKWLSRFDVGSLTEAVLELWRGSCRSLLPNPKNYTSGYGECVRWVGALSELDTGAFDQVMGEWGAAHKRRRNLWSQLREAGL